MVASYDSGVSLFLLLSQLLFLLFCSGFWFRGSGEPAEEPLQTAYTPLFIMGECRVCKNLILHKECFKKGRGIA